MKAVVSKLDVTYRFELTKRELQLLNNLLSYENKEIAKNVPNSYEGEVTVKEMREFLDSLRDTARTCAKETDEAVKGFSTRLGYR